METYKRASVGQWRPWRCELGTVEAFANRRAGKSIFVFGDSQAKRLANAINASLNCSITRTIDMPICPEHADGKLRDFFGVASGNPVKFDCADEGGESFRATCIGGISLEFVHSESVVERRITTLKSNTTRAWLLQELLGKRELALTGADFVVGSLGHEEVTRVSKSGGRFESIAQSFRQFANLIADWQRLSKKRFTLLLISDSKSEVDHSGHGQDSYHIHAVNDIAEREMSHVGAAVVDTFSMSHYHGGLKDLHSDAIHLDREDGLYYKALARTLLSTW